MQSRFLGVVNYEPQHLSTLGDLNDAHRARLTRLRGSRLTRSWVMWDAKSGWFRDGPVILEFGETRLEIAAFKFDICLSWNSIALDDPVEWFEGSDFELSWRQDALEPLAALEDSVDAVLAIEYRGGLNGFAFEAGDAYVELFNALDEIGIASTPSADPEVTRRPL